MSIDDAKCTILPSSLASSITSFFVFDFRRLPCWYFLEFAHSLSTAAVASSTFIAWNIGINLCTNLQWFNEFASSTLIAWSIGINLCTNLYWFNELIASLQYDLHYPYVEFLPYAVL